MATSTDGFIRPQIASQLHRAGQPVETARKPAVWTLAHRGYSGSGRLDVWVYRTKKAALRAGAELACICFAHPEEQQAARTLFNAGKYQQVLDLYEDTHPDTHLLRVQVAFLQEDGGDHGDG
ncbi:hypothetical protein ACIQWA_36780 [Kitasatospora sp. NPDC098652]|uniref:hypothetical protein n=1 Tax=Kitasatospora sp. NPDC098652 TaxID=3364095 RepID=UPI003807AE92